MSSWLTRRSLLAASSAAAASMPQMRSVAGDVHAGQQSNNGASAMGTTKTDAIVPFRINIAEADLEHLRRRLAATRWPSKELVRDRSQGVQLATLKELVRYWATEHDWRKTEAKLNALPQFTTEIDGGEYPLHSHQVAA
jgi:hypothetical protein